MKKTLPSGWELNDWDGQWSPDVLAPKGSNLEIDLFKGLDCPPAIRLTDNDCCRSDMGGSISCSISVPVDAVVALLQSRGYHIREPGWEDKERQRLRDWRCSTCQGDLGDCYCRSEEGEST